MKDWFDTNISIAFVIRNSTELGMMYDFLYEQIQNSKIIIKSKKERNLKWLNNYKEYLEMEKSRGILYILSEYDKKYNYIHLAYDYLHALKKEQATGKRKIIEAKVFFRKEKLRNL